MSVKLNAQKVRLLLKNLLWSQEDLAEGAGLGLRTIQRIERNSDVSVDTLKALAAAFNISADELVIAPSVNGLKIGTFFGFAGNILGTGIGTTGVIYSVTKGGMSGYEAGIYMGLLGLISGVCFAFVGCLHYWVKRDMARTSNHGNYSAI